MNGFQKRAAVVWCLVLCALLLFVGYKSHEKGVDDRALGDEGEVIVVYDGDTIKVRFEDGTARKVRLIGVDALEMEDKREEVRLFAHAAKRFCFYHLYRKKVRLGYDWEREDRYGRLLAYVWPGQDLLFNEFIIQEGFASAFLKFPFDEKYRQRFRDAERTARERERGFWQKKPFPVIPACDARKNVGKYITVEFLCSEIRFQGSFAFLGAAGDFAALIHHAQFPLFPDIRSFEGQRLSVTGFLEEYKGKPQIVVSLPLQIGKME